MIFVYRIDHVGLCIAQVGRVHGWIWRKVHKPMDREIKLPHMKSMFQDKSHSFVEYELTSIIEIGDNITLNKQTCLVSLIKEVAEIIVGSYHAE